MLDDWLDVSCAFSFTVAVLILAVTIASVRRRRCCCAGDSAVDNKIVPRVDDVLEGLTGRFLAHALYQVMLERGTDFAVEERIYNEYGNVNMCPTLDDAEIFKRCPELRCDGHFLHAMNRWLTDNGQQEECDYFSAAAAIGRVAVERFRSQAEKIVESC